MRFMYSNEDFAHTSSMTSSATRTFMKSATLRTVPLRSRFIDLKETTRTLGWWRCAQYPAAFTAQDPPSGDFPVRNMRYQVSSDGMMGPIIPLAKK